MSRLYWRQLNDISEPCVIAELLITAGGENVAPVLIEDTVKECLPCVSNCMLVGDARKFLSVLLTMKVNKAFNLQN